jgi:hypothetical protein
MSVCRFVGNGAESVCVRRGAGPAWGGGQVRTWVKELRKMLGNDIPITIAGNKSDLEKNRHVKEEDAQQYVSDPATHTHKDTVTDRGMHMHTHPYTHTETGTEFPIATCIHDRRSRVVCLGGRFCLTLCA